MITLYGILFIFEKGTLASLVALGLASLSLFQVVATDVGFFQKAWELMWQNNKITVTTETSPVQNLGVFI